LKISKTKLKQIIKEVIEDELGRSEPTQPEWEKTKTSAARTGGIEQAKQSVKGGINDLERGIIIKLQQQLISAAKVKNIASGRVLKLAKLLSQELAKATAEQEGPTQP
tara:strand:- start:2430 stop:2753 length:324 start_codon:yes stop_codon:yes gene_type:complete